MILDNDGERIVAKYYDENGKFWLWTVGVKAFSVHGTVKEQKAFEKTLFQKTCKSDAEILLLDGLTIVFKANVDLLFYVIGSSNENELLLNTWV